MRRLFKYLLILVVFCVWAAGAVAAWLFVRAQPTYSGHADMPGLSSPVNVYRDDHGVPHIFAANMNDAARALGYIHADERLFQMEMQRRAGAGRLSEILGSDMLDVDKFTRTLGLYRLAEKSFTLLSPDTQQMFLAYAQGVNQWLTTHQNSLPPEFIILRFKPEPWTVADSIVWGKLMALQLSGNYHQEITRAKLAKKLTPDEMTQLFPPPPNSPVTTDPHLTQKSEIPPAHEDAGDKLGALLGLDAPASNEWVISGAHTTSGKPVLANDPHLGLEIPVLWYLARIKTPDLALEGATVPGLPIVLLGQNEHVAWGFTTTGSDVQDLFIESVDADHPDHYKTPEGSLAFEQRQEIIRVKGQPNVTLIVRRTRHGPVLSDIDKDLATLAGDGKVMALAFTALDEHDATSEALVRMNRAPDAEAFLNALRLYRAPPQNIVYADTKGSIGFVAAGAVPVRKNADGRVPVDGASGDGDWVGTIPFEEWPQTHNPAAGFVFNANNAVVSTNATHFYGTDWEEPFRAERLQQLFDATATHGLDTSMQMQADHVSLAAQQLLPYLLKQDFADTRATDAINLLRGWNGAMDRDQPQPLIFEAWMYELHRLMLVEKTGDPLKSEGPYDAAALTEILENPGTWCAQGSQTDCTNLIKQAFEDGLALLTERDGEDMSAWRWGKEHQTVLRHKFYTHLPVLKYFADKNASSDGDFYTLDRGGSSVTNPAEPFIRTHGGGFRGIYDLSDPRKSRFMIASGQSGHLFTPHYADLFKSWNHVQSFTLTGSEAELKVMNLPDLVFDPTK